MAVPFIRPSPPRLSEAGEQLRAIEDRGIFSNFGPVNTAFERNVVATMFAGEGACMTVCNATVGLMLAIQQAITRRPTRRRYALMPSFTFAATAQAAIWCGLTPLFCDIDPLTWAPSAAEEERLLAQHGDDIAVVVPYATFGYDIDLARYESLMVRHGVPVVVDAAASLGTISADGRGFGSGFSGTIVFSMHATKAFATSEAGVVYSATEATVSKLRQMCNFGFGQPRIATMPGLNGKLSEVGALLCQLALDGYDKVATHRAHVMQQYRLALPGLSFQPERPTRQAHQFIPALLPPSLLSQRAELSAALTARGIGSGTYFSPHLYQQSYFAEQAEAGGLPVSDDVGGRIVSLPVLDLMTEAQILEVTSAVESEVARLGCSRGRHRPVTGPVPVTGVKLPDARQGHAA